VLLDIYNAEQPSIKKEYSTMATQSKRQQARNERALQELIKTVPGNDRCADCQARNPGMLTAHLFI
jgi:hypothetical protein